MKFLFHFSLTEKVSWGGDNKTKGGTERERERVTNRIYGRRKTRKERYCSVGTGGGREGTGQRAFLSYLHSSNITLLLDIIRLIGTSLIFLSLRLSKFDCLKFCKLYEILFSILL